MWEPVVNIVYFFRIASVLAETREIGMTNLAMAARMNYKRCSALVDLLEERGYVTVKNDGRKRTVIGTEKGMRSFRNLISSVQPTAAAPSALQ